MFDFDVITGPTPGKRGAARPEEPSRGEGDAAAPKGSAVADVAAKALSKEARATHSTP